MEALITVVEMTPSHWVLWPSTSVTVVTLSALAGLIAKPAKNQTMEQLEFLTHHKHQPVTVSKFNKWIAEGGISD